MSKKLVSLYIRNIYKKYSLNEYKVIRKHRIIKTKNNTVTK